MKIGTQISLLLIALCLSTTALQAGTPAQEKAFTDKYKAAFESKDTATLQGFLYSKGANPMALEFYKTMQSDGIGGKVSKIELVALTPEEAKKAAEIQDGPGGERMHLPLPATRKLKITVETKDGDSTSSSTSESFIAEVDGKFYILVPASVK